MVPLSCALYEEPRHFTKVLNENPKANYLKIIAVHNSKMPKSFISYFVPYSCFFIVYEDPVGLVISV